MTFAGEITNKYKLYDFFQPDTTDNRRLIQREHSMPCDTFDKIFGYNNNENEETEENYDFLFLDKTKKKFYKNFDEKI